MGAFHRQLSTYLNDLIASGFALERIEELHGDPDAPAGGLFAEIPTYLAVAAHAA
jgi:hypothetical protein